MAEVLPPDEEVQRAAAKVQAYLDGQPPAVKSDAEIDAMTPSARWAYMRSHADWKASRAK